MAPTPYQPLNLTPGGRDQCPGEAAMTYARFLAVALALALPAAPAAAGPAKPTQPTCARELAVTETSLLKTLVRIQSVGKARAPEQCETYRAHAAVVTKARDVFERCSTGPSPA